MSYFKVGVMLDSLRKPTFEENASFAARIGADGFQMYYNGAKLLTSEQIAAQQAHLEKCNLTAAAICGDIGGWEDPSKFEERLERTRIIMDYTRDLGAKVVTSHIGRIPEDVNAPVYQQLLKAMEAVGRLAGERGLTYAIETGPETTAVLREFLDRLDGGVGVNFDPANLVMAGYSKNGADSVAVVAPYIVHTHAKDGTPAEHETPLGEGGVDFHAWLTELKRNGYKGFLTIERECGDDPAADCKNAMAFLRKVDAEIE